MADILESFACRVHGEYSCQTCEIAALRAELERAQADIREYRNLAEVLMENNRSGIKLASDLLVAEKTIARQRAWIESAGHRPECPARGCAVCGYTQGPHEWGVIRMGHAFQPSPCDCGYAELVGG